MEGKEEGDAGAAERNYEATEDVYQKVGEGVLENCCLRPVRNPGPALVRWSKQAVVVGLLHWRT